MVDGKAMFSQQALDWPGPGWNATFDVTLSRSKPGGANGPAQAVFGDALDDHGQPLPIGTRIEARAGSAVCAAGDVAPVSRVGYVTYVLIAVQPAPAPCGTGATMRFYIHGRPSRESLPVRMDGGVAQLEHQPGAVERPMRRARPRQRRCLIVRCFFAISSGRCFRVRAESVEDLLSDCY